MNNSRPIFKVVFLFFCFLFLAPNVQAATLVMPATYQCDGLTFTSPLTLQKSKKFKNHIISVSFGKSKPTMNIGISKNKEILAEAITPPSFPTPTETPKLLAKQTETTFITTVTTPTETPTPLPPTPAAPATYVSWGLSADKLFDMSNQYRASKGLPAFQKDDRACQLASSRAPEIGAEIAEGHMHSGLRARNLPYWNSENIISYSTEEGAFNWWINDNIHREQIEGNYTYSCVACNGNSCAQEFTNFQAK